MTPLEAKALTYAIENLIGAVIENTEDPRSATLLRLSKARIDLQEAFDVLLDPPETWTIGKEE